MGKGNARPRARLRYVHGFLLQVLQGGLEGAVGSRAGLQVSLNLRQLLHGKGDSPGDREHGGGRQSSPHGYRLLMEFEVKQQLQPGVQAGSGRSPYPTLVPKESQPE